MDESEGQHAKWNKVQIQNKRKKEEKPARPLLHVESIKVKYTEAESRMVVTKGRAVGEMRRC